jgi:general secretion pathway protein F
MPRSPHKPLPYQLRAELFTQLAQMEIAGLPYTKAFAILELGSMAASRLAVARKLAARGVDPAKAGAGSGLFTVLETRLVAAAISAGSPAGIYRRLGDFYTKRAMQVATMKSRMVMPACVLLLSLFIQPLPKLIAGTISVTGYLVLAIRPLVVIALIFFAVRWLIEFSRGRPAEALLLRVPLLGTLMVRRNVRDFFESLALMLEAGISMLDALPAALDTIEVGPIKREFSQIADRIENGAALAGALKGLNFLNEDTSGVRLVEFVTTGEASGTLPEMLFRHTNMETEAINAFYQQLADWTPRIVYGLIMVWMAYGLLTGGGFMPRVPKDL